MAEACPVVVRSRYANSPPSVAMVEPPPLEPTLEESFAVGGDDSAQLALVGFLIEEWRAGRVSAAEAKAALVELVGAEVRTRPSRSVRRVTVWLLQARRFRKGVSELINKAVWQTLKLTLPIWHWDAQWRGRIASWGQTRFQLMLEMLEQVRKLYHELQELGSGRLTEDPERRVQEMADFQMAKIAEMEQTNGVPRRRLPPMEERPDV